MHQPPPKTSQQSVETVIADLEVQRRRLDDAVAWTKGVNKAIRDLAPRGLAEFSTSGFVNLSSRSTEIVLSLPTPTGIQDIPCFTIVGSYTSAELVKLLADPMSSVEAIQQVQHQKWLQTYRVRPFDVWTVPESVLWHESEAGTSAYLGKQVKQWLGYWFGGQWNVQHRRRHTLSIESLGVNPKG